MKVGRTFLSALIIVLLSRYRQKQGLRRPFSRRGDGGELRRAQTQDSEVSV